MKECTAKKYKNCFGDELYEDDSGKAYCIMHAPLSIKEKLVLRKRFIEVLSQKRRSNDFDFSGCQFDDETKFYHSGGKDYKLILRDCEFYHKVDLSNLNLGFSDFTGSIFYKGII
jgi:hypothetical protein